MTTQIQRLALAFLAAFSALALTAGYWTVVRQEALVQRPDNPRRLLLERRAPRGAILDRHGAPLAESPGEPGAYTRYYPYPPLAPVLGYVSPLYGAAGVEADADAILHGDAGDDPWAEWWSGALGFPPQGRAVRLTLDLSLQRQADEALAGQAGAVVMLDAATGELLALASHPAFDPNRLEEDWPALVTDTRAPLLNRATAALYQPGGALQPALLAAALQRQAAALDEAFPAGALTLGPATLDCRTPAAGPLTLPQALAAGCPAPFAALGERLGGPELRQLFTDLRLLEALPLGLPTVAAAPDFSDPAALAAGQGSLTLTPLHLGLITAALTQRGQLPAPRLIQAVQDVDGTWTEAGPAGHAVAAFTPEAAAAVSALLPAGHTAEALAGAQGQTLAWFTGFAPLDAPRYVVVVLLEAGPAEAAARIGRALLAAVP